MRIGLSLVQVSGKNAGGFSLFPWLFFCCYFLLSFSPTSHAKKHQNKSESKTQKMCLVFHLIPERATGKSLLTLHGSDPLCWITRVKKWPVFDSWLRWSFEEVMNLISKPPDFEKSLTFARLYLQSFSEEQDVAKRGEKTSFRGFVWSWSCKRSRSEKK